MRVKTKIQNKNPRSLALCGTANVSIRLGRLVADPKNSRPGWNPANSLGLSTRG